MSDPYTNSPFHDPTGAPSPTPGGGGAVHPFPNGPKGEQVHLIGPAAWKNNAQRNISTWRQTASKVRHVEGPRGVALRWSVGLRYIAYFAIVIGCSALVGRAFAGTRWAYGGSIVLFSSAGMLLTATLGTMFMADRRTEILEELRKFLFQMLLFPSTAIAVAHWYLRVYTADPGQQNDFLSLLDAYLPMFFLLPALLSLMVFVKAVVGMRFLNRSQADAEEMMNIWARQDYHQS